MTEEVKQEQEQEPVPTEFVFCGVRVNSKEKKQYLWARVAEPDNEMWFSKPLVTAAVGGVYVMAERRGEGNRTTVYSSGKHEPRYLRRFVTSEEEKAYVTKWAAADEAARQQMNNKALLTKAAKVEPLGDLLERVTAIAANLNRAERRALLSKLAEALWL